MATKQLHPLQEKLLTLLSDNIDDPLTVRALQEALGVTSTSVVAHHMQQLEKKGYLKRNPYNPRDYQLVKDGPENRVSYLNLYGLAQCGPEGSILDGDPLDKIPLASMLLSFPASEAFMLKAKGRSMEPKIEDGDLVILRQTSHGENGKIYACVNNGEALIKKLHIDGNTKLLLSLNSEFAPFSAAPDFRVEGEVKAVISRKV